MYAVLNTFTVAAASLLLAALPIVALTQFAA